MADTAPPMPINRAKAFASLGNSSTFRMLIIGFIALLMNVLFFSISELVSERQRQYNHVLSDYVGSAFRNFARAAVIAVILSALYGLLLVMLRSENLELLLGTVVLVVVMSVLMFVTRRIATVQVND